MKGRITVKLEGVDSPFTFHFGLWVIEKLQLTFDAQLMEMYDTGEKDDKDEPIIRSKFMDAILDNQIKFTANLLYWGRYFYCELQEEEIDFNMNDAYLWLDAMGMESKEAQKINECFTESLKSHLPKTDEKPKVKKK